VYQYPFYLLKTRRFLPFFMTQFLGAFNDNAFKLSVLTLVSFHLTHTESSNQLYQALGTGLFTLPFFLFSASAGQLADKYDKAMLMRLIKTAEVILMIFGAVGLWLQSIPLMFTIIFLMGVHSAFFGPIKYAILPDHLKQDELLAGNAFVEAATFMAILAGTVLGTLLIPQDETVLYYSLMAAGAVVIIAAILGLLCSLFIPHTSYASPELSVDWNVLRAIPRIINEARKYPIVFRAIVAISWFWFLGAVLIAELPAYVQYVLKVQKDVFSLFLALFSVGIGVGSLLESRWLKGEISAKHVPWALIGLVFFLLVISLESLPQTMIISSAVNHPLSLSAFLGQWSGKVITVCIFLLSVCGGIYVVPLYTLLQKHSPPEWRSRLIAMNNIMNALFMVGSMLFVALLAWCHAGAAMIFKILALLSGLFAIYTRDL